jgi:putative ABC transport system permease protein
LKPGADAVENQKRESLTTFISRKYLRYDPSLPFISITAGLAFLGVAIGVMVLIVAMALMQGMIKEFENKLFVMNYPLTVQSKYWDNVDGELLERLEAEFPGMHFSPYIKANGIARSGDIMEGVIVFGIDAKRERAVNSVFAEFKQGDSFAPFEAMIGKTLEEEIFLPRSRKLMVIFTSLEPVGIASTPLMKRFDIKDTFDSGLSAYDKAYIYTDIEDLRKVLRVREGLYHGIHILSDDPMKDIAAVQAFVGETFVVSGWWEKNKGFFSAIAMEKKALFIVLMLIILVASLNIVTSLLMTVMNRRKEIALLISLGASKQEVKKIFFTIGMVIGVVGIFAGIALGFAGLWVLDTFEVISLPKEVYGTTKLPLELSTSDFLSIVAGAFAVVLVSSFYPAKKASEIDVLTVLRSE